MGAKKWRSHPSGLLSHGVSNSSQNTSGVLPRSCKSRIWWKAPASSSEDSNCDRLNVIWASFSRPRSSATCLIAKDFPAPGGPKTATASGVSGRLSCRYSCIAFLTLRTPSISCRSALRHFPIVSMGTLGSAACGPSRAMFRAQSQTPCANVGAAEAQPPPLSSACFKMVHAPGAMPPAESSNVPRFQTRANSFFRSGGGDLRLA